MKSVGKGKKIFISDSRLSTKTPSSDFDFTSDSDQDAKRNKRHAHAHAHTRHTRRQVEEIRQGCMIWVSFLYLDWSCTVNINFQNICQMIY